MGHASSRPTVDSDDPGGKSTAAESTMLLLNCGCNQKSVPDDRQYQYYGMKSSTGTCNSFIPEYPDDSSVLFSSPPYMGSSYGEGSDKVLVHVCPADLSKESSSRDDVSNIPFLSRTIIDPTPDENSYINTPSSLGAINTNLDGSEAYSVDIVAPRTLFNPDEKTSIDTNSDSHTASDSENDEDDDDSGLLNPHPPIKRLPCGAIIPPILTAPSEGYLHSGCLGLSRITKESLLRSFSAQTPPTLASTGSDSSIDSSFCSIDEGPSDFLPSFNAGKPISLQVTETYTTNDESSDAFLGYECFSYDPLFNFGEFVVSTANGVPYGHGLAMKMIGPCMHLQDHQDRVWAVARNRSTFIPSFVVYATIPRYRGQRTSSHRLPLSSSCGSNVKLFPWALVKKEGRRIDHDVTVHMVVETNGEASSLIDGQFEQHPRYISRPFLEPNGNHSHFIVNTAIPQGGMKSCGSFVRQLNNRTTFDVTIAPGIDPLLMICVLAIQCKMNLEPKLNN